jgi:hypothetical protein
MYTKTVIKKCTFGNKMYKFEEYLPLVPFKTLKSPKFEGKIQKTKIMPASLLNILRFSGRHEDTLGRS